MADIITWAPRLGTLAGVILMMTGVGKIAIGSRLERPFLVPDGRSMLVTGTSLGVGSSVLGVIFRKALGGSRRKPPSGQPAREEVNGGGFHIPTEFLLWVPLGLGAVVVLLLGSAGISRWRKRETEKRQRAVAARARWDALEVGHDAVRAAYGGYLADVLEWLDRPALEDVSVPQTAALLHALDGADDAQRGDDVDAYCQAVAALKTAWKAADAHARKTGTRHLPAAERKAIDQARKLLATALDTGGASDERRAAYAKARRLLEGVLTIPPQASEALDSRHRLSLPHRGR
ncbi:hypothetical protein ABZW18_00405 [Streptomyces sp. NPDC004647]|uniref:hypothetical protein n=1 Tax=Streptomyces sp. NPDC004647 TaxID=3154671 RepID=UPI00339F862B